MDTLEGLRKVFGRVLDLPPATFGTDTSQLDIEQWDSIAHVSLVLAIEQRFSIEFTPAELGMLNSIGAIRDIVDGKLGV